MLTQAMNYDRILAGSRSHQTSVNGENNSVVSQHSVISVTITTASCARGPRRRKQQHYGFVRLEGDLLGTEVAGMSVTTRVYGAAPVSSVDVRMMTAPAPARSGMMHPAVWADTLNP